MEIPAPERGTEVRDKPQKKVLGTAAEALLKKEFGYSKVSLVTEVSS